MDAKGYAIVRLEKVLLVQHIVSVVRHILIRRTRPAHKFIYKFVKRHVCVKNTRGSPPAARSRVLVLKLVTAINYGLASI